jgi:nitrite reductase/ring-hydroxylating ferredoxin subunit
VARHRVPLSVFGAGDRAVVALAGREIALFRVDGEIHAFENACPHEGNPLIDGEILGPTLTCVYHNWRFDLETGACLAGDDAARRYPAELGDGEVWINVD